MIEAFLLSKIRVMGGLILVSVGLVLSGCESPVGVYHDVQGGAIDQPRQAPPGANLPYPNLASVPPEPHALTATQQTTLAARLNPASPVIPATEANPAALAGLTLPGAPPPVPSVPGMLVPVSSRVAPLAPASPAILPPAPHYGAPLSIEFQPGSAVLNGAMLKLLHDVATARGGGTLLAAGFGEQTDDGDAAMVLALRRAQAIANALTANGVPAKAVTIDAVAAGSGGFVRLLYLH